MKHLIDISQLSKSQIEALIQTALHFKQNDLSHFHNDNLRGQVIANLFFEPSTRTRNSFEIAAYRLGAFVISPDMKESALVKGETVLDTIKTLEAMGVHACILRHAENGVVQELAANTKKTAIINAGDGSNQHPTQALIDLMTISEYSKNWPELVVSIVGDIKYSRVARSLIQALTIMGVKKIRVIAPKELLPAELSENVEVFHELETGLKNADVIVCLRLQKERMSIFTQLNTADFAEQFCVTPTKLALAKKNALIMHPGPMNRDIEIASSVADGPQSAILRQVTNGIAIRMSVLQWCLL